MTTKFFLILSLTARRSEYELTCAISGEVDGWRSTPRYFTSREEVETALRGAGVIVQIGPNQLLSAAASRIPVAFSLESPASAIALQLLYRVNPERKLERTMVTFHDLNGSLPFPTAHYQRDRPITVGERLEVDTPLGKRVVEVLAISKNELASYGSDDTRRNMTIDVRF